MTTSTSAALAAKQATTMIPIKSAILTDPIGNSLAASHARPGGKRPKANTSAIALIDYQSSDCGNAAFHLAYFRRIRLPLNRLMRRLVRAAHAPPAKDETERCFFRIFIETRIAFAQPNGGRTQ